MALRRPQGFTDSRVLVAAIAALASWTALDAWMTWDVRGHYMRAPAAGAPFSSATARSGSMPRPALRATSWW